MWFSTISYTLWGGHGSVGGGAASLDKGVNYMKLKSKQLGEQRRHDLPMEQGAKGKGLYSRLYKGYGLYLKPYLKNFG